MSAYSIVDIPGWEQISLFLADADTTDRRVRELAYGSVPETVPRDTATPFREEVRKHFTRLLDKARAAGAGMLCIPTSLAGDVAVPASYTVTEWRDAEPEGVDPSDLLDALAERSDGGVAMVDVDGQPGLREEAVVEADPTVDPLATHDARRVTYTISSPNDPRRWVVFTFTTLGDGRANGELADILVELFDAHMTTLRWILS